MRLFEFAIQPELLTESETRIHHAEDIIFWEGWRGAAKAIESLKSLEQDGIKNLTVKWDGSPAIVFGRDVDGNFILTDKSGFKAKGYNGKSKSPKELETMLLNRKLNRGLDVPKSYMKFAANMKDIFDEFEKAVPKNHVGYFAGDLLYFNKPDVVDGKFVFTPNVVTYSVNTNNKLGQQIAQSKTGIVIHRQIDLQGNESMVSVNPAAFFKGKEVLVFPSVTVTQRPKINDNTIKELKALANRSSEALDKLLNYKTLTSLKLSDFSKILYTYLNAKVDTGLNNLGTDFLDWLVTSKVSKPKQQRIVEHIKNNKQGFTLLWQLVSRIQSLKNDIINQLDKSKQDVEASINGTPGGEGYVLANANSTIKLVNRAGFTAANRAVER